MSAADQVEQLDRAVASVAAARGDKRLHVFDVKAVRVGGRVTVSGRVLSRDDLQLLRVAVRGALPADTPVDDAGVRVLRQDPPAVRVVATTLTDLHAGPSFLAELLTQVTNGTELEVLQEEGEWCYVRQRDGYLGWAYGPYLADAGAAAASAATHLVAALALPLYADPDVIAPPPDAREAARHASPGAAGAASPDAAPAVRLPIGTAVAVAECRGGLARVVPAGPDVPGGWARLEGLRPIASLPPSPDLARRQIVADAQRLTGVYYLWGGGSAWGIDCSGLTQLCHRLAGHAIPRDASLQFPAGRVVEPPYTPGDLLFFHGETSKDRITHVGISLGGMRMIHSSRSRNGVYPDDLDAPHNRGLRDRLAGARSFVD